ncbi:MAG: caspase family protein [Planctomycetaceae bacterium]|nr:caspase family protein [Planctomycetaceae bacterium]
MKYYCPLIIVILLGLLCEISYAQRRETQRATQPSTVRQTPAAQPRPEASNPVSDVSLPSPPAPQGDFRALLVVVQKYPSSIGKNLPNAWADISHISNELKKMGYKDIVVVSDEGSPNSPLFSTEENVLRELDRLTKLTKKDDSLMVVVASHGESVNGVSSFRMPDHTRVSIKDIYATLQQSPSTRKLLLVEACRTSVASKEFIKGMKALKENYPKGLTVFHACSEGEQSWSLPGLDPKFPQEEHSVFLHYLAKGLDEADYVVGGNNGDLTVSELYNYLENKVKSAASAKPFQKNQRPETFSYDSSFVIGKRPIINPFLKMRIPMESHLDVSLDQLAESGNIAIRNAQKRLGMTFLESWSYMRRTSTMPTARFQNIHAYADAAVADYARGLLQTYWQRELTRIGDQCFSLSIELRNDPKSCLFRADMYRSLGLFIESLNDYNQANTDMNLYILLDKVVYSAPPEGIDTLATRQANNLSDWIDQSVNQEIRGVNPGRNPQEQHPSPLVQDDLDERFEQLLKKSMQLIFSQSGMPKDQADQYERATRNQWRGLTLAQKRARLDEAERQFLQMGSNMDRGTVYQGNDRAGALTTKEFESQFALGTLANYHARFVRGNNTTSSQTNESGNEPADSDKVCRLLVQELRGRGNQVTWIKATVCDLGAEFDVWIKTQDVFWSKDLAENYWVSVGEHSSQYRNAQAAVQANVQAIHNSVMAYESISSLLSSIPYVPISLPGIAGIISEIEGYARAVVEQRIRTRMGEANGMISQDYYRKWWDSILELETKSFQEKFDDSSANKR